MAIAPDQPPDMVTLFESFCDGDRSASDALFDLVHADLRRLARAVFKDATPGHTLQATALVNEAWLRMAGGASRVEDRHHFFAIAARAMRHVLADHAKGRSRLKRGGDGIRITFNESVFADQRNELDLLMLNDALDQLGRKDERMSMVAELRILGTLSFSEIADVMSIAERTARRDWQFARLWLLRELQDA